MTANYPLRWDPVPAGCHGDIARASVNAGAAARNHTDPELTGKSVGLAPVADMFAPFPRPHHPPSAFVINKRASLCIPPGVPFHCLCLNTTPPAETK